jgi:hypothetical protein
MVSYSSLLKHLALALVLSSILAAAICGGIRVNLSPSTTTAAAAQEAPDCKTVASVVKYAQQQQNFRLAQILTPAETQKMVSDIAQHSGHAPPLAFDTMVFLFFKSPDAAVDSAVLMAGVGNSLCYHLVLPGPEAREHLERVLGSRS